MGKCFNPFGISCMTISEINLKIKEILVDVYSRILITSVVDSFIDVANNTTTITLTKKPVSDSHIMVFKNKSLYTNWTIAGNVITLGTASNGTDDFDIFYKTIKNS